MVVDAAEASPNSRTLAVCAASWRSFEETRSPSRTWVGGGSASGGYAWQKKSSKTQWSCRTAIEQQQGKSPRRRQRRQWSVAGLPAHCPAGYAAATAQLLVRSWRRRSPRCQPASAMHAVAGLLYAAAVAVHAERGDTFIALEKISNLNYTPFPTEHDLGARPHARGARTRASSSIATANSRQLER